MGPYRKSRIRIPDGRATTRRVSMLLLSLFVLVISAGVPAAYGATSYVFLREWGSSGSGDGQFIQAWGIAVDTSGHVFVSDLNNRINEFSITGTFIGWLGKCTSGANCDTVNQHSIGFTCTAATCSGLTFGSGNGQFNGPRGLAVDTSGNVYVTDEGNQRIQVFSNTGTFIRTWGSSGAGNGQFAFPFGVAVDHVGNVYVADTNNERVQTFTNTGTFITKWGSAGSGDGQFNGPVGIAVDHSGHVYVAEQFGARVDKFTTGGVFIGWAGRCTSGVNCDTVNQHSLGFSCTAATCGVAISGSGNGQFNNPMGVATDSKGSVFVVDANNFRVQKLLKSGTFSTTWGSNGCGTGQFGSPLVVAVGPLGTVYVTDTNGSSCGDRVEVFSLPPTSTVPVCVPASVTSGSPTTCTVTVSDIGSTTGTPKGKVKFTSDLPGIFSTKSCPLSGSGISTTCSVTFTPSSTGTYTITAIYQGNASHAMSQGKFTLTVTP